MVSVASGGPADRMAERILFKVLRAGSGTPARYSSTFFGAPLPFAAEPRLPDFTFFMRAILREFPLRVHAPDQRPEVRIFQLTINPFPPPRFFISVASKGLEVCVSGLESTLAGISISVASKGVRGGKIRRRDRRGCGRSGA